MPSLGSSLLVLAAATAARATPPAATALDPAALDRLVSHARETKSDALVVLHDGRLVGEWTFDSPAGRIETMSMTKSLVALAVGLLVTSGKIPSFDAPLTTWFPELKQGRKQRITLRHVLTQTSGLQTQPTTEEIYASPDFVQLALAAELTDDPGARFTYNNKAMNLIPEIVRRACGKPIDAFLASELFAPLGIEDFAWAKDGAGHPHGMSGLQLRPRDLARIGQLLLDEGRAGEARLLSPEVLRELVAPASNFQKYALGWWLDRALVRFVLIDDALVAQWRARGVSPAFVEKVLPLKDRVFGPREQWAALSEVLGGKAGLEQWYDATWRAGLPDIARIAEVRVDAWYAQGYLGQWLVVRPRERLVVVRMRRTPKTNTERDDPALRWDGILADVAALAPSP